MPFKRLLPRILWELHSELSTHYCSIILVSTQRQLPTYISTSSPRAKQRLTLHLLRKLYILFKVTLACTYL